MMVRNKWVVLRKGHNHQALNEMSLVCVCVCCVIVGSGKGRSGEWMSEGWLD